MKDRDGFQDWKTPSNLCNQDDHQEWTPSYISINHRSAIQVDTVGLAGPPKRSVCSTIQYLFQSLLFMHVNKASDTTHFWHAGRPIQYFLVNPATFELKTIILGPELHKGQVLQFTCLSGWWKAAEVVMNDDDQVDFGLLSESLGPAFEPGDNSFLEKDDVLRDAPHLLPTLERFLRPKDWARSA
ncbi:hypothetical protein AeRB84_012758 [Aphanomyces euteiches]|nr:hypothetical protein AeRB84_012758 [Aphanomyces euteiches]